MAEKLSDFPTNALDLSRRTTRKKNRKSIPCKIECFQNDDFATSYRVSESSVEQTHGMFVPICKTEEKCEIFGPGKNDNYIKNSKTSFDVICKTEKCVESSCGLVGNGAFNTYKGGGSPVENNLVFSPVSKIEGAVVDTCKKEVLKSCTFNTGRLTAIENISSANDSSTNDAVKTEDQPVSNICMFPVSLKTENLKNGYSDVSVEETSQGNATSTSTCSIEDMEENLTGERHKNILSIVCKVEASTENPLETSIEEGVLTPTDDVEKSLDGNCVKTEITNEDDESCDKLNDNSNELTPTCEIDEGSTESASPTCESEETEIESSYELSTLCEEKETPKPPPKANYHCEICLKQFTRKDSLAEHVRIHTGEMPYKCHICSKRFSRKKDYYKHRAIHRGERHACHLCFKEFAVRSSLRKHIQTHNGEKHHKCGMCDKQFAHKSTLLFHLKTHTGEEPHHCEVCGKKFARKNDLSRHWLTHSGEKNYQCELCFKQFSTKSNLSQHLLIHSDVKTYQCEKCLKLFSQKTGLLKHMPIHSEKNFECKVCHKQFSLQSTLTKHMQTHAEVKPYQCELCFKRFALKSTFSGHLLTHTGERHHPCELCPKRFARKSHLARHMLTHTGEKPHKCEVCLKAFAQKSDITQHMLTHTGEKPHHCTMCNKKYSKRSHLTHHVLNHHADKLPQPDPVPVPLGLYPSPIPNPPFYEFRSIEVKAAPFPGEACIVAKQSSSTTTDSCQ